MSGVRDRVAASWLRKKQAERGSFDLFRAPPQSAQSAPPKLFDAPPKLFEAPPAPAEDRTRREPTPPAEERTRREPTTPPQPARPAPQQRQPAPQQRQPAPQRPGAPGRPQPPGDQTQALRGRRDFKEFLRAKYEAGRAEVPHPDPRRRQRRPTVKFWTAMKYDPFKAKVKKEFEAWRKEQEAARPRAQVGQTVQAVADLREGDFLRLWNGKKLKVVSMGPNHAKVHEVGRYGNPLQAVRPVKFTDRSFRRGGIKRIDPPERADIRYETFKSYALDHLGHPDKDVKNQEDYRKWLEKGMQENRMPYVDLQPHEKRHLEQLREHIDKFLKEQGVDENWKWEPPKPPEIGERVRNPKLLQPGHFINYVGTNYRVVRVGQDNVWVQRFDRHGVPKGVPGPISQFSFKNHNVKRIEPVKRPDVEYSQAKEFIDELGFPGRDVRNRSQYKDWLKNIFLKNSESPFHNLQDEEKSHKKDLEKYLDKILEDRNITQDWQWRPPPRAEIGQRIHDPFQLHQGDFFSQNENYGYRVIEIKDDGSLKVRRYSRRTGLPDANFLTIDGERIKTNHYRRIEEVKRPEVEFDRFLEFAEEHLNYPSRDVKNQADYYLWIVDQFRERDDSPFFRVSREAEPEAFAKLEKHVNKLLELRKIGPDWKWTPPPPVKLPSDSEWQKKHDQLRKIALEGKKVGRDISLGGGINGGKRRRMKLGDEEHDFAFKSAANEQGDGVRHGTPSGTLHLREQATYNLDRLLGEGAVVPPTVSDGDGSYQAFIKNAVGWDHVPYFSSTDLARHPEVQRTILLDLLVGHEDRHRGNLMYSWADENGPETIENLRIHAIDNGYSFASPDAKTYEGDYVVRHPWASDYGNGDDKVARAVLQDIPKDLHEKLKKVDVEDAVKTVAQSGVKDKKALMALGAKLMALQDNPKVIGDLMGRGSSIQAQQNFHLMAGRDPAQLLRDHTGLPASALSELEEKVNRAIRAA